MDMHSPAKDDPITSFCKATSESRESALFFLEGFSWDLDNAVSGFLRGHLPPIKKPPPLQRSRSRSPSRRRYSTTSSLKPSLDVSRESTRLPKDATHDGIIPNGHAEKMVSMPDHVNLECEEEGSSGATSIEIGLPFSDHDSDSTS